MRYSLVSREIIADSIETVVGAEGFDGFVAIGGCDKNMPGCAIAMARLNRPSVFVYGGTIRPGAKRRDIVSVFEAVGGHAAGKVSKTELDEVERTAIPGPGSCGGMYTANTMASAMEALGLSLPGSSAQEAVSRQKRSDSFEAGQAVVRLIKKGITPSMILTREAFENAVTVTILHLLAIARAANVDLSLDDFTRIGRRVPVLADLRPSGRYAMSELIAIGGVQPLMKRLLKRGLLHGNCLTVTGRSLRENLKNVADYPPSQTIVRSFSDPIKKDSHLVVMRGGVAPEGGIAKITGKEGLSFVGRAKVFDGEERATEAILGGRVQAGDVVVIRYEGPRGGPGMREMLSPTGAIMGLGLGDRVALTGGSEWRPDCAHPRRRSGDHRCSSKAYRSRRLRCGDEATPTGMETAQTVCHARCSRKVCKGGPQCIGGRCHGLTRLGEAADGCIGHAGRVELGSVGGPQGIASSEISSNQL
jgi:dihydroxy-acid dehydratase